MNRRDFLKLSTLAAASVALPGVGYAATPKYVICDFDMGLDVDDAGDAEQCAWHHRQHFFKIIAVAQSMYSQYGLQCSRAIFENRHKIFLGPENYGSYRGSAVCCGGAGDSYGNIVRGNYRPGELDSIYPTANTMYRTVLAQLIAQGRKCSILVTGFASTMADLLKTTADGISGLTGVQLVEQGVEEMVFIAGNLPGPATEEWNILNDIADAQYVTDNWPTTVPITWVPINIGHTGLKCGPPTSHNDLLNPVRNAYHVGNGTDGQGKRTNWSGPGIWHLAYPGRYTSYAGQNGKVTISGSAVTEWTTATNRGQRMLQLNGVLTLTELNALADSMFTQEQYTDPPPMFVTTGSGTLRMGAGTGRLK